MLTVIMGTFFARNFDVSIQINFSLHCSEFRSSPSAVQYYVRDGSKIVSSGGCAWFMHCHGQCLQSKWFTCHALNVWCASFCFKIIMRTTTVRCLWYSVTSTIDLGDSGVHMCTHISTPTNLPRHMYFVTLFWHKCCFETNEVFGFRKGILEMECSWKYTAHCTSCLSV